MALHTLRIVDSIAATPTTRLDVNDEVAGWLCTSFDAPPPRLRRSVSANAMRDGINVSSANYEARVIRARFRVTRSAVDLAAAEVQKMARELDRAGNFLMLQQSGSTKPVFFVTYRSDFTDLAGVPGDPTAFEFGVEILAEPFALGLRETLGPFTVNNDPAAGSNGLYFDVTGVIGDVEASCVLVNTSRTVAFGHLAVRQHGTPTDMVWLAQAESVFLAADTTNPGGGPDAAMSGTGTNNFARTSFATLPAMNQRLSWDLTGATDAQRKALRGTYRLYAVVRRSDATSVITVRPDAQIAGEVVTVPQNTGRQLLDLGLVSIGTAPSSTGYGSENSVDTYPVQIFAERVSGTGTIDWDFLALIPADEASLIWTHNVVSTSVDLVIDGVLGALWRNSSGDPFAGTARPNDVDVIRPDGRVPSLVPSQTNRLFFLETGASYAMTKTDTSAIEVHYWPRYLHVRPSAT